MKDRLALGVIEAAEKSGELKAGQTVIEATSGNTVHMCRGNEGVAGLGSGGYDAVAERVLDRLKVDGYLLEYDTPRAGDFAPLRFLPKDAIAVLGLISTKVLELESMDTLKRRVDEAARVVDLDRLGLCPQCGFASLYRYDRMGLEQQERKLELLVATAREIWR